MRTARLRVPVATLLVLLLAAAWGTSRRAAVHADGEPQAPARLSETGLYAPGQVGVVAAVSRPFLPQYPLWTDGATKRRWIQLPAGTTIDARATFAWQYPVGTRFFKEFAFGGRKVETRMLWKTSETRWVAASYVWMEDQQDALLAPERGVPGAAEVAPGRRHSIPATADCVACHGSPLGPLGFNALQLSTDRDPNAIHGEPLEPGMLTLASLVEEGLLAPRRDDLVSAPPRIRSASPKTRAALGYLAVNCGSCHRDGSGITANLPSLAYADVAADGDAVARSLLGRATRWQRPGAAEGESVVVDAAAPEQSALVLRMGSRRPSSQMPPLGSVVRDEQALAAVSEWIRSDLGRLRTASR